MNCTNKQQETCDVEKLGCDGCYYNKEVDDLTTVYLSGFYDGEKKWKDKIKAMFENYKESSLMTNNTFEDFKKDLLKE
jgi:hypothetical protein